VGSTSEVCSGAVTLTWMEWVASRDTCRDRWISEGSGVVRLSMPLSRIFVMRERSEGVMEDSEGSGNMAWRRSRVEI
jgi:hypothetical protein